MDNLLIHLNPGKGGVKKYICIISMLIMGYRKRREGKCLNVKECEIGEGGGKRGQC